MKVFLLGAGRPARGRKPSALKNIALRTRAMDWQIHSFRKVARVDEVHYLGGYHVDAVIRDYPQVNYTVIPDWEKRSILHTFLKAPFTSSPVVVSYSDTIFRSDTVAALTEHDADVTFGVDSLWRERFDARSREDMEASETVLLENEEGNWQRVEFTGLICFRGRVVERLTSLEGTGVGVTLLDLIDQLRDEGFSVESFDVAGHWAEFNFPDDIARFVLGSKADTLARLEPLVQHSHIGRQVSFTALQWHEAPDVVLRRIDSHFSGTALVIRSSSSSEDGWHTSNAGSFESLLNVDGGSREAVILAIDQVVESYGHAQQGGDQILVQEFVDQVRLSGVVFTCGLDNGAPYYRFNFDDRSARTDSVTSGKFGTRTLVISRFQTTGVATVAPEILPVLRAVEELEQLLGFDRLDIEFAVDHEQVVHIFQVRPITVDHSRYEVDWGMVERRLETDRLRFQQLQNPPPFIHGEKVILANMPDWNPAEIIGTHPKPFALSLYQYLVGNEVWADQRVEYGYRDVRPYPLILALSGQPYVDVRGSLNSFIPASLSDSIARKLAAAYLEILSNNPHYHDKIEFEVAFTVWTPDFLASADARLSPFGIAWNELEALESCLKQLTRNALGRLQEDISPVHQLIERRALIEQSSMSPIDKIYALLSDCRQLGMLAFSHAARAGFVTTALLKSMVDTGVISEQRRLQFMRSVQTVMGEFEQDKRAFFNGEVTAASLLERYGHLRPGTYEINVHAYWENPQQYLFSGQPEGECGKHHFEFSDDELQGMGQILEELGSTKSVTELVDFFVDSIRMREWVKFEFTKNLSRALDRCVALGEEWGIAREMLSYLEFSDIEQLRVNALEGRQIEERLQIRMGEHAVSALVELPPLIRTSQDFYCFERLPSQPNFITHNRVEADTHRLEDDETGSVCNKIILIPQADPGYDWLFSQGIAGLVTQHGGANSHMAIRAAEMGLPAAIGVGERLYEEICSLERMELDCANQVMREVY